MMSDRLASRTAWFITALCMVFATAPVRAQETQAATPGESQTEPSASQPDDGDAPGTPAPESAVSKPTSLADEILVTAERRSASIQEVPVAMNAFGGEQLSDRGISNTEELTKYVPNLTFNQSLGNAQLAMRGVGDGWLANISADPAVAFYIDNVYMARPAVASNAIFSNVERVEVLRGPQGTLYGRNSTGGVIHIITKGPSEEWSITGNAGYEEFEKKSGDASLSGPLDFLGDGSGIRLSAGFTGQGKGYSKNLHLGNELDKSESLSLAGSVKWVASEDITVNMRWDYFETDIDGQAAGAANQPLGGVDNNIDGALPNIPVVGPFIPQALIDILPTDQIGDVTPDQLTQLIGQIVFGGTPSPGPYEIYSEVIQKTEVTSNGGSLDIAWDMDHGTLRAITGYRETENFNENLDTDATEAFYVVVSPLEKGQQVSQELIYTSEQSGRYRWSTGLFYFHDNWMSTFEASANPLLAVLGASSSFNFISDGTTNAFGVFGEVSVDITPKFTMQFGGRYVYETKQRDFTEIQGNQTTVTPDQKISYSVPLGRVVANYRLGDTMVYASVSRGFRSGGFDAASLPSFDPEYVIAYEAGTKSTFLDGQLTLNLAGFQYNYKDQQQQRSNGLAAVTENSAESRYRGFEVELVSRPMEFLTIDVQLSYLDAVFQEFENFNDFTGDIEDLSGNHLPRSPKYKAHIGIEYARPINSFGLVGFRYDGSWSDSYEGDPFNRDLLRQEAYFLHDMRLFYELPNGAFRLTAYVKNLGDEAVFNNTAPVGGGLNVLRWGWAPPRRFGVTATYRFWPF